MNPYSPSRATLDGSESSCSQPELEVAFQNSFLDRFKYSTFVQLRTPLLLLLYFGMAAFFAFMQKSGSNDVAGIIVRVIGGLIVLTFLVVMQMVFTLLSMVLQRDSNYSRSRLLQLTTDSVIDTTDASRFEVRWFAVHGVRRSGSIIYIRLSPGMAHCIPRRAFADAESFKRFGETAITRFKKSKEVTSS